MRIIVGLAVCMVAAATVVALSAASGGGAGGVCSALRVNPRLFDALMRGTPTVNVRNPTPASVVASKLGQPVKRRVSRDRLNSWWVYGNTAYLVVSYNAPGENYIATKACDWAYTQTQFNRFTDLSVRPV
jgi:hypothetical protein